MQFSEKERSLVKSALQLYSPRVHAQDYEVIQHLLKRFEASSRYAAAAARTKVLPPIPDEIPF